MSVVKNKAFSGTPDNFKVLLHSDKSGKTMTFLAGNDIIHLPNQ